MSSRALQEREAAPLDVEEQASDGEGVVGQVRLETPATLAPQAQVPYIHLDWNPQDQAYRVSSNVPNFEWVILRYAKALREQVS